MTNLNELDSLIARVSDRFSNVAAVNASLEESLAKARKTIEEKELDKIRSVKEKDRIIETLSREKMELQKEKEALEAKLEAIAKSLRGLLPDSVERR